MPVRAIFIPVISVARVFLKYQIAPRFICTDDEYIRFYISLLLLPSFLPSIPVPSLKQIFQKILFERTGKTSNISRPLSLLPKYKSWRRYYCREIRFGRIERARILKFVERRIKSSKPEGREGNESNCAVIILFSLPWKR